MSRGPRMVFENQFWFQRPFVPHGQRPDLQKGEASGQHLHSRPVTLPARAAERDARLAALREAVNVTAKVGGKPPVERPRGSGTDGACRRRRRRNCTQA